MGFRTYYLLQAAFNQVLLANIPPLNEQNLNFSRCITPEKPFEKKTDAAEVDSQKSTLEDLMKSISEKLTITNNVGDTSISRANTGVESYNNNIPPLNAHKDTSSEKDCKNPTSPIFLNQTSPKLAPKSILRNSSRTPAKNVVPEGRRDPLLVKMNNNQKEDIKRDKTPEKCCCTVKFQPSEDHVMRVETQVVTLKYLMKELFKSLGDHS